MQIGRLFEMVYLLLDRKTMTAAELAERFEVSVRTVYRDVEILAQAGIPIYAQRGKQGGIRLTENFVLSKTALSEEERRGILAALQSMGAVGAGEADAAMGKLSALFGGEPEDWIEIDFSDWNPTSPVSERFQALKEAVLARRVVAFRYSNAEGETVERTVEPVRLVFRGYDWYLLAWCRRREDFRYFKLNRMEDLDVWEETFLRKSPPEPQKRDSGYGYGQQGTELTVEIDGSMAYRVRDGFLPSQREERPDGSFLVRLRLPENEWLYESLMTYGGSLRVVEPERIRAELARRHRAGYTRNLE